MSSDASSDLRAVPRAGVAAGDSDDLRARILRAALRSFAERGYTGTSMRAVAEEAGCTKPALYYHFGSKQELFAAVVDHCHFGIRPTIEAAIEGATTTRERVQRFADALLASVADDPLPLQLILSLQTRPDRAQPDVDLAKYHRAGVARMVELLAPGVDAGELRADLDLHEAAEIILGALHARVYLATKGIPIADDATGRIVDLLFRGLAPRT